MTKLQQLKRKLLRNAMFFSGALIILSLAGYFLSSFVETKETKVRQEEGNVNVLRSRISQLEQKFNIYETSFNTYNSLDKKLKNGDFNLDTAKARTILNKLREDHRIANLTLQMTTQNRYGQENPSNVGIEPVFREVTLTLAALSDLHIYAFIEDLEKTLPGYIHFTKATLQRTRPLSDDILREVSVGSTPALINANITFVWLGISQKKPSKLSEK